MAMKFPLTSAVSLQKIVLAISAMVFFFSLFYLVFSFAAVPVQASALGKTHEPDVKVKFRYVQDGADYRDLKIPTYEWIPEGYNEPPGGIIVFVHGLTLHGKKYDLAGKAFASGNYYAVSFDMRGFGRCYVDPDNKFHKKRIDYEGSYQDMVELVKLARKKYPGVKLILVGESLGATPCLRLASQRPEDVDGIILSGPAVTVNPVMLVHPQSVFAGAWGLVIDPHFNVDLGFFMRKLVSQDTRIVSELENDPLIRKKMTILDLLRTDAYVKKNVKFARKLKPEIPLLILQGSKDRCVVPRRVTKLLGSVSSDDQTLRWMQHLSHLLLETKYINSDTVSAIASWIDAHEDKYKKELEDLDKELVELGAESL